MRYSIIMAIIFLLLSFSNTYAQEYEDFYLKFETAKSLKDGEILVAWATIDNEDITVNPDDIGQIMPMYDKTKGNTHELIGKVVPLSTGELEIQLKNTAENRTLLENNAGLIKIKAKADNLNEENLIYDIYRLGINMFDIAGEKNFISWVLAESVWISQEASILKAMVEESDYVAGGMRGQMEAPMVTEGRFKGMDLFDAMEMADENDVRSFLRYVDARPFKYQGTDWKFSEVFATWIAEGAPTTIQDLENLASSSWGEDDYFLRYFKGVSKESTVNVLEHLRTETGEAIDDENLELASQFAINALILARNLNDPLEIAWAEYKRAKVYTEEEKYTEAKPLYEKSMTYFNQENVKTGILIAGNDAADNYNKIGGKANYKEAVKLLEKAIGHTSSFGKNDKSLSPIVALMYRNLGKSHEGLKKYKKALAAYEAGLEYTHFSIPSALKRKATIELYMSELYQKMGNSSLADKYSDKAVATYLEYEAALTAIKKL